MKKIDAILEAAKIADADDIVMVVTHNPYDEFEDDENSYGYYPESSYYIVAKHETLIATIYPDETFEVMSTN
jgi:hypothetical protein